MKAQSVTMLVVSLLFVFCTGSVLAQNNRYVGSDRCRTCHQRADLGDAQTIWEKSKHAQSYQTLLTQAAKDDAKAQGLKTTPEKSTECLICHVTGPFAPKSKFDRTFKIEEGIGCETCHGPGSGYRKKRIMTMLREEYKAGGNALAKRYEYQHGNIETCAAFCHQPEVTIDGKTYVNSFYKPFDLQKAWEEIAHPLP
jgi:hypothetical protein